ncbi:MAG TPA: hypothetical protein VKH46_03535 [Thermoanaerobaculia bacterium]|jgi:hypothetical protein|nr:hypothetical protein [Thermoanaerobaculia bacterium]
MRKLGVITLLVAALAAPAALQAKSKDSPGPDKEFLGVDTHKGKYLDQEYVADGVNLSGKTIHVYPFELKGERPDKEKGDLSWKELPDFIQSSIVDNSADRSGGAIKLSKTSGSYSLRGQVTEFRPPSAAASWGGWIGQAAGSGTIVFDFKIEDPSGKVVVAAHHKLLAQASDSLRRRMENVAGDEIGHFLASLSK